MAMARMNYGWIRFWCPRGESIQVTSDGFLIDPLSDVGRYCNSHVRTLESLLDEPCLVLLGEAGIGKTTELRTVVANADADDGMEIVRLDLGEYGSEESLQRGLFDDPVVGEWIAGDHCLVISLDGLDEALLETPRIKSVIDRGFRGLDANRLQLRITCRTGAWPETLTQSLRDLFGHEAVGVYELVCLRRSDIVAAAQAEQIDDDEFLSLIEDRGAGPLAVNPTSLKLLLRLYLETQSLPGSLVELYERGLRVLCATSQERSDRSGPPAFTDAQLLEVASRIAAIAVLTRRNAVYTGAEVDRPDTDVPEPDIVGGQEAVSGTSFDITPEVVHRSLTHTGLFSSRGPNRLGFAHRTYGEFLAARYVHKANLSNVQLQSLFFVLEEDPPRLIPQVHEVAAWLGSMDATVFARIVDGEPEVLLLSDVTARDDSAKSALVQSLFGRVDQGELSRRQVYDLAPYLHRLQHEGLSEYLQEILVDRTRSAETRQLAIEIAKHCKLKGLTATLADLALNTSLCLGLRVVAAYGVVAMEVDVQCERLKPLAKGEAGEDPYDQLKGCGLRATWPQSLTASELFQCLTAPRQANFTGAYQMFLHDTPIADQISFEDLPTALEWAEGLNCHGEPVDPRSRLAGQLAYGALNHLADERVRLALARLILRRLKADTRRVFVAPREGALRKTGEDRGVDIDLETGQRRSLVESIVEQMESPRDVVYLLFGGTSLAIPEDVRWIFGRIADADGNHTSKWVQLASLLFSPLHCEHLELWFQHKTGCDAIAGIMPWPESVTLDSPEATEMRDRYREAEQRRRRLDHLESRTTRLDPPAVERVRIVLNRCLTGEPELFWFLMDQLRLKDDKPYGSALLPGTVHDHPGWEAADDGTRKMIVEAARRYLREAPLGQDDPYTRDERYVADTAPGLAVQLLLGEDPGFLDTLDASRWRVIGPLLLMAPVGDEGTRRSSAELAYRGCPDAMRDRAIALIERSSSVMDWSLIDALEECLDEELAALLLEFLRSERCSGEVFQHVLGWLVRHGFGEARALAESLLVPPRLGSDQWPRLCREAALVLIAFANDAGWDIVWAALEQHTELARHVLRRVAHDFDRCTATIGEKLTEQQLGQLVGWFFRHYGPGSDPVRQGAYFVGPDDSVRHWRDGLLSHLSSRATRAACAIIQGLRDAHPECPWLHDVLLDAQRNQRRNAWVPPDPSELLALVRDRKRRYIGSPSALLALIEESLAQYEEELHGTTPAVTNLWDRLPDGTMRPKEENHLSDDLARHLRRELQNRGVAVNREVQIRRLQVAKGQAGQETDILINALARQRGVDVADVLTVIVETKGCWHREGRDAMKTQLVDRYLNDNQCQHGMYVLGWFLCDGWDDDDYRKRATRWNSQDEAMQELKDQAKELTDELGPRAEVRAYVLDCTLR